MLMIMIRASPVSRAAGYGLNERASIPAQAGISLFATTYIDRSVKLTTHLLLMPR
jgi:hypothetical protein